MSWKQEVIDFDQAVQDATAGRELAGLAQLMRWFTTVLYNICLVSSLYEL